MADLRERLEALCAHHGVITGYDDVWGEHHAASDDTLVRVLRALGVAAGTPHELLQAEQQMRVLRPHEEQPGAWAITADTSGWSLPLRLAPGVRTLRWTVIEEGGAQHHGVSTLRAGDDGVRLLVVPLALPAGYHRLQLGGRPTPTVLVAAPAECHQAPALRAPVSTPVPTTPRSSPTTPRSMPTSADTVSAAPPGCWGPAVQLYALRSQRNWGMGDFTDLATLVAQWGARGAGLVGVNPLHALFSYNPRHISPYSPSSRQYLNTLYLDVEAVPDLAECEEAQTLVGSAAFQQRLLALRDTELVDHAGVAEAKSQVLALLYRHFRRAHLAGQDSARAADFRAFQQRHGPSLRLHATHEAVQAHWGAHDPSIWGWPVWPEAWRDPHSPEVAQFAATHEHEIEYFEYLQWLAEAQLTAVTASCRALGMAVGLYLDLAVSVDRAGSDTWAHSAAYALDVSVGAPPDEVNPQGQGWGLPPLRPEGLTRDLRLFVATLRAVMRHAGAVRIDHVMGLLRLYWIPPGASPRGGAYVRYPLRLLLAVVVLESVRNRCMVIGEDLGTVPDEMRAAMRQCRALSYRLFYFERNAQGGFQAPAHYPRDALVAVSTHDLPTLAGWWLGHDLDVREALGLWASPTQLAQQRRMRVLDRQRLPGWLAQQGAPPAVTALAEQAPPYLPPPVAEAVQVALARAPSQLMVVQMEDVWGVLDQANLPGTVDEHPNWRRKLPLTLEAMADDPRLDSLCTQLAHARPRAAAVQGGGGGGGAGKPDAGAAPATQAAVPRLRVPRATYRLQLHAGFDFEQARAVLPYLAQLGVSHVYCSPIWRARPGSPHGYDVVAHGEINPELGGAAGFERLARDARALGLGLILDVVPNHMAVLGAHNPWWHDVLENGQASPYAAYFDIDWHPVNPDLEGKVLLPVLGEHYGDALAAGHLHLGCDMPTGQLELRYHAHRFPLAVRSYPLVLGQVAAHLGDGQVRALVDTLRDELSTRSARARHDPTREGLKTRWARLLHVHGAAAAALHAALAFINGELTRDTLHALHEVQHYRLAYWRVAADEINYRRFFDINELAALRVEEPAVFDATQGLALDLAARGLADGLRVDHPDGLYDPAGYFARLQAAYAARVGEPPPAPDTTGRPGRPLYVVAEKITAAHEDVPESWAIHGTTGYRFAALLNGVLVDGRSADRFERIWQHFSGERAPYAEWVYQGKRSVARTALASELTVLATAALRIARVDRRTRDHTFNTLRDALAEVAACMPVYRTYILGRASAQDLRYLDWAVAHARRRSDAPDGTVFDFVSHLLRGEGPDGVAWPPDHPAWQVVARFQQFCAPVAAKGMEDTALYRYHRLSSLNEVGGDPGAFDITVRAFHGASADRAARWPHTLLATSTHDNKRSEDVRNRLHVLSEMPAVWRLGLARWRRLARGHPEGHAALPAPSGADEYLLYQTLLGTLPAEGLDDTTLPAYRARIEQYMLKAAREAKTHTRWTAPDEAYETALLQFVRSVLARVQPNPVLSDLQANAQALAGYGALNSLSLVTLKLTSPGVPDLYQGNEMLDLSLVDPDNRRPVDFAHRQQVLTAFRDGGNGAAPSPGAPEWRTQLLDGRAKLWLTWRLLQWRARHPALLSEGRYLPLTLHGARQELLVAFAREHEGRALVVLAPRLYTQFGLAAGMCPLGAASWGDTTLDLSPVFGGERIGRAVDVLGGGGSGAVGDSAGAGDADGPGAWPTAPDGRIDPAVRAAVPVAQWLARWPVAVVWLER